MGDIWPKYHSRYFTIVPNGTRLMACELWTIILKYQSWYLCQITLQIMLLFAKLQPEKFSHVKPRFLLLTLWYLLTWFFSSVIYYFFPSFGLIPTFCLGFIVRNVHLQFSLVAAPFNRLHVAPVVHRVHTSQVERVNYDCWRWRDDMTDGLGGHKEMLQFITRKCYNLSQGNVTWIHHQE